MPNFGCSTIGQSRHVLNVPHNVIYLDEAEASQPDALFNRNSGLAAASLQGSPRLDEQAHVALVKPAPEPVELLLPTREE